MEGERVIFSVNEQIGTPKATGVMVAAPWVEEWGEERRRERDERKEGGGEEGARSRTHARGGVPGCYHPQSLGVFYFIRGDRQGP